MANTFEPTDHDCLLYLTQSVKSMGKEVDEIKVCIKEVCVKVDELKTDVIGTFTSRIAVLEERTGRLQSIVYGVLAAIGLETLALIGGVILWLIQRK